MLVAANTGAIIAGIAVLLIFLGLMYLVIRLLTWPFRARRRKRPVGAGADYEAMIRQQGRNQPATQGRPLPFPPPEGWQASPSADSQIVLPPPPYRTREPETHEPPDL